MLFLAIWDIFLIYFLVPKKSQRLSQPLNKRGGGGGVRGRGGGGTCPLCPPGSATESLDNIFSFNNELYKNVNSADM